MERFKRKILKILLLFFINFKIGFCTEHYYYNSPEYVSGIQDAYLHFWDGASGSVVENCKNVTIIIYSNTEITINNSELKNLYCFEGSSPDIENCIIRQAELKK